MEDQDNQRFLTSSGFSGNQAIPLIGWLALSLAASGTAVYVSTSGWYAGLNKPVWNPPGWIFGPVWTLLYVMMGTAAWLVWREGGWKGQALPLGMFLVQWSFNVLWTPLFFGAHRIELALVDIGMLWLALAVTLVLFWRVCKTAGTLLAPYLAWVSFAAALNLTIWSMNP